MFQLKPALTIEVSWNSDPTQARPLSQDPRRGAGELIIAPESNVDDGREQELAPNGTPPRRKHSRLTGVHQDAAPATKYRGRQLPLGVAGRGWKQNGRVPTEHLPHGGQQPAHIGHETKPDRRDSGAGSANGREVDFGVPHLTGADFLLYGCGEEHVP
jgi:hypothetical protein